MKKTIVINLFGGPGSGKSTGAAYIFSKLKMLGYNCELVSEFVKDKIWEENKTVFDNQLYILGKQSFKMARVYDKVDIIITDAPLFNNFLYLSNEGLDLESAYLTIIKNEMSKTHNINIFVNRVKKYNPAGRHQSEKEADKLSHDMKISIASYLDYSSIDGNIEGYDSVISDIVKEFNP